MKNLDRSLRKSYAMERMASAIDRAIGGRTGKEKERAARWAAAWGLLCGIRTEGVKLRRDAIRQDLEEGGRCPSDQIEISAGVLSQPPYEGRSREGVLSPPPYEGRSRAGGNPYPASGAAKVDLVNLSATPVHTECAGLRESASIATPGKLPPSVNQQGAPFAAGIFDPDSPQSELPPDVHV